MQFLRKLCGGMIAATAVMASALPAHAEPELKYDWGVCDTVAMYNVGPGITYTKLLYHSKPLILWLVEIDLTNPYNKVEQAPSRMSVPDTQRWTVPTFQKELSTTGHNVRVAWNHDFFSYDGGYAIGLNIHAGQPNYTLYNRSVLAFDDKNRASVFRAGMTPHVTIGDQTVYIDFYNRAANAFYGQCVLFNMYNVSTLSDAGRYIALQPLDTWGVNRPEGTRCRVTAISDDPIQTTKDTYVLYLRDNKLHALDNAAVGDIATVYQTFSTPQWGVIPENIMEGFHGYVSIVHDGVLHKGEYDDFENGGSYPDGRSYELSSRTMVGINKEGTRVYVAVNEAGSVNSASLDCIELAAFLVECGANDVVNYDSGGSAAISLDGEMLNYPMRGGTIRPVADAMLAVSTAPDDNGIDNIGFSNRRRRMPMLSALPLSVIGYNQYGDISDKDITTICTYACEPAELGYVDADGVLHTSDNKIAGKVIASYQRADGVTVTAEMPVFIADIEDVQVAKTSLLIDDNRRYTIGINGVSGGIAIDVDPSAFAWSVSPEGIVSVDDNGTLTGIANGTAIVTGTFRDLTVTTEVTVEITDSDIDITRFDDEATFGMKYATALIKNMTKSTTDLPEGWDRGVMMNFDLKSNRNPVVTFNPGTPVVLYSLPESLTLTMKDFDDIVTDVKMDFVDAEKTRFSLSNTIVPGQNEYKFVFAESDGTQMRTPRYPLTFEKMYFTLVKKGVTGARLALRSLTANYPGTGAVSDITVDGNEGTTLTARQSGENIVLYTDGKAFDGKVKVRISTLSGALAQSGDATFTGGTASVYAPMLSPGVYFVSVYSPDTMRPVTAKLILR